MANFTIITINYNCTLELLQTISSLKKQTRTLFEYIVIDGKSNDLTSSLIKEISDFADTFISETDKGIADAWNKGIKLAKNDMILILNSGETLESNFLEQAKKLCQSNNKIYCFSADLIYKDNPIKRIYPKPFLLPLGMYIAHNFTIVPTAFYRRFGLYSNLDYSMDYEWFLRNINDLRSKFITYPEIKAGNYPLGGLSDKYAIKGFKKNLYLVINQKKL